eukprot:506119_1
MMKYYEYLLLNYSPDFDDYVQITRQSIGYSPTKFIKYVDRQCEYHFEIPDVGGTRSECRKWWSPKLLLDDDLQAIIFVVPLSDYNATLYEDNETNRLKDSIELFKNIMIKGKFFKDKRIMLFFKVKEIPITESESDPNNVDDVMKFVDGKFVSVVYDNEDTNHAWDSPGDGVDADPAGPADPSGDDNKDEVEKKV